MLSTEFLFSLAVLIALGALFVALGAFFFARRADIKADVRFRRTAALRELAALQSEMTELADAIASYGASLKKLRARVGMREARAAKANGSTAPDQLTDPEAYKRHLRAELQRQGRL